MIGRFCRSRPIGRLDLQGSGRREKMAREPGSLPFLMVQSAPIKITATGRTSARAHQACLPICTLARSLLCRSGEPRKPAWIPTPALRQVGGHFCQRSPGANFPMSCSTTIPNWQPKTIIKLSSICRGVTMRMTMPAGAKARPAIRLSMPECVNFGRQAGCTIVCG